MTSQPLFMIAADLTTLMDELYDLGGELTSELAEKLDALEGSFVEKLERCAVVCRNMEAEAEKHKAEAERQKERVTRLVKSRESLLAYMKLHMETTGNTNIAGVARVQKNGGKPPIAWLWEPEKLPEEFRKVSIDPDLTKAHEALAKGESLPEGFVVGERGSSVRILL